MTRCPGCKQNLDGAIPLKGRRGPKPGDYTICAYCFRWLEYNETMNLILADKKIIMQNNLPLWEQLTEAEITLRKLSKQFKKKK